MAATISHRARSKTQPIGGWYWPMVLFITGLCGATAAATNIPGMHGGNTRVVLVGLAAIIACVLAGGGVLRSSELTWRAWLLVGVSAAIGLTTTSFSPVINTPLPVAFTAVPAIFPIIFAALPLGRALAVTVAFSLTPALVILTTDRPMPSGYIPLVGFITVLGLIAAPGLGIVSLVVMRQRETLLAALTDLAASRAESTRLSNAAGAAAERERMAREIHDTLAQGFTSIVALSQAVKGELESDREAAERHIDLIQTTARENLAEARAIVAGLAPLALTKAPLAAAIQRQCDMLTAESGISVSVDVADDLPTLGMATDVVLLRSAQEALTNIVKHASATAASVTLAVATGSVRLTVADNGIGFDTGHAEGFGLRGMKTRVAQVGGTMSVTGTPGGGVTLEIEVPV